MTDELRAHRRLNVDFDANITAHGLRDHPCKMRDFCLGGALLSLEDPLRPLPPAFALLERGAAVELRVTTRSPGFRNTYTFTGTVARRDRQTLGVSFANPDPTSLMALQSLASVSNAQQRLGARTDIRKVKFDEAAVRKAIAVMKEAVQARLRDLPKTLIADVQQPIQELAKQGATNDEQVRMLDTRATLRRYAGDIESGFLKGALKPLEDFSGWQAGATLPGNSNASKLSLIDKNAFEDWLAVKVMVSRAEADCKQALFELQIRFNEMFGAQMGVQNNPVGPAVFYHALGEPIQKMKLPKPVEQLLLRTLENLMLERLAKLYPELNELLARNGIMPDLEIGKYAKGQQAGSPPPPPRPAPAAVAPTPVAPVAPPARAAAPAMAPAAVPPPPVSGSHGRAELSVRQFELQQQIARQAYATVQRLLAARDMVPGTAEPATTVSAWEGAQVRIALEALQRRDRPEDADIPLRDRILGTLDPDGALGRRLEAPQERAVDTVGQLFVEMLGMPLLRDDARTQIRRLEVPFLKLLLADPEFLANERHPARMVLNRLATLGARGAMTTPVQQQNIEKVVASLVSGFDNDVDVFGEALAVLDRMLDQQRKVYQHNLLRVRQSSEGHHKVVAARRRVMQILEEMIGGRRVPRAVLTLLDAGWRESLVNEWLRHGAESAQWQEAIGVIGQMVEGMNDPARLDMKSLLGVIKRGLASQATGQINRDAVVNDLREMFTALSSGRLDAVPAVDVPPGAIDAESRMAVAHPEDLARWLRRARELEVGSWIELAEDDSDEFQQARLAWVDDGLTQFVFVNLQGMKVLDLDVESFARALRDGRARRIDDPETPLVDRGLEAMVQKVYGQLAHRATHDELTGLCNRKEFERRLQKHVEGRVADDAVWTLCWIDLDQFKIVNSTCGFESGDRLIAEVAKRIVAAAGSEAQVARLGGDEFAVLAPGADESSHKRVAERLLHAIEEYRFQWQDRSFPLAASAGVVFVTPGLTAEAMMKAAEAACYAAKEAGRNRVHVFQEGDAGMAQRDDIIRWVARLNQAIEQDRLRLRCQRIEPVDPASGLQPHYEILLAIEDENGEFIPPGSFMQAAERYNRMHAVDRWVIHNTLEWMHANKGRLDDISGFSINLSGQSLNDERLTTYILQQVTDSEVAREKVTFEVTETAAIANLSDAADFIREMQAIGCKFSLDDFGSGLSSYSYLKNLPVDYVKIDGAFIRDIHHNMSDYMMVRSINEMAHFMGKRTIAEYVENDEILARLREIGIDYAQGYGIEKPKPLDAL
ncbi:MAG: DUF1631 family protein [Pseudomonadota bacterium]